MTVKELKELLNDVPDNYRVGYTTLEEICENWGGTHISEQFEDDIHLNCDIKNKELSLLKIRI